MDDTTTTEAGGESATVPLPKFQAIAAENRENKKLVGSLQAEIAALREAQAATAGQVTELATVREELDLARIGLIESEAVTVARALHNAMPADGRPSLVEAVKAWKGDLTKAPRAMQGYLGGAANAGQPERVVTPPPSGGGVTAPATGKPDATALKEARLAAIGKPANSPEVQRLQALLSR